VLVYSSSSSGLICDYFPSTNDVRIGGRQEGWSQEYPGLIDDVRIYDRVLSAALITTLYDSTR